MFTRKSVPQHKTLALLLRNRKYDLAMNKLALLVLLELCPKVDLHRILTLAAIKEALKADAWITISCLTVLVDLARYPLHHG